MNLTMKFLSKILRNKGLIIILCFFTSSILSSCDTISINGSPASIGSLHKFQKELVKGGDFWITTYQKITDKNLPYVFYIEGDGNSFVGRRVSKNPTPRRTMFIKLAVRDDRANVVYIARPCQYTPMDLNPKCTTPYWTHKRLSDDSVEAINQVINSINNNKPFSLVGFSGGGGIAVLIAARNSLVKDIITVSGNLDHEEFTKHHNVLQMVGSLNPIDYATKINHIPQLHLSGGKDRIIPPFIVDKFVQASNSKCVKYKIFPKNYHEDYWESVWEYVLSLPLTCY